LRVNDTNGGVNNQSKIHNFYANGNVVLANSLNVSDSIFAYNGNITANTGVFVGNGAGLTNITSTGLANGTSNVSIPVSNGNVNISTNGNANVAQFDTNGGLFLYPTTSSTNGLRINSYGNPVSGDVSRIASFRARGNASAPLSVEPNDNLLRLLAFGHNGNIQQTSSTATFIANVDSSYTANTANIPIGWQLRVNDTNGGVNNQAKTHFFYSNGNVSFNNLVSANNLSITNDINCTGSLNLTKFKETTYSIGNVSGTVTPDLNNGSIQTMTVTGNITLNSLANVQIGSSMTLKLYHSANSSVLTSSWLFAGGQKTLSAVAGSTDIISVFYDGQYFATLTTGYL